MLKLNKISIIILLLIFTLVVASPSWSAVEMSNTGGEYRFGQVKAVPRPLQWRVLKTPHFEIFFYQGLEELALRAREILEEEAFGRVFPDFRDFYTLYPYRKNRVILFASRKEYQNSQASGVPLYDSSEGVAHILINRLVIITQPTFRDLRGVLTHEITHLITIGPFKNNLLSQLSAGVPGWIAEGLAEFYMPEETRFALREVALRDAVLRETIDSLEQISEVRGNLHYAEAWSLVDYIVRHHDKEILPQLLKGVINRGNNDQVFEEILGCTRKELWQNWKNELPQIYYEGAELPSFTAVNAPLFKDYGDQVKVKVARDGKVAFLSNFEGRIYGLYLDDGKKIKSLTDLTVSAFDFSPDGKEIVFLSDQSGERKLYLLNLETGQETPFALELPNPVEVAWSPCGERLAVAVNTKGDSDLYLVDLKGKILGSIACSPKDETSPAWSPSGEKVAYVSPVQGYDQIYIWDGKSNELLTRSGSHHREPVWGEDGRLYCLYGKQGYYQPVVINPEDGKLSFLGNFQETVLEILPEADSNFLLIIFNAGRSRIYRFQS